MSASQGATFTGYESISPYRSYLDLSFEDREFTSNTRNPLVYSEESSHHGNFATIPDFQYRADSSTYGIISRDMNLGKFREFIDKYELKFYMDGDFTLFVPVDTDTIYEKLQTTPLNALDIFNYHKLDYVILPVQLFDKKIRLQTKLRNQYILTSGTSIISEQTDKYPNRILSSIKTDNGYIYVIERSLIPYVY
jgi:hypothetical protein